jgi:hypothetical protein
VSKLIDVPVIATFVFLIGLVWIDLAGQFLYERWALKRIPDRRVLLLNPLAAASVPLCIVVAALIATLATLPFAILFCFVNLASWCG